MFNKKLLASTMAAAISVGVVAQVQAIEVKDSGIGQLLIQPVYVAGGGLETNLVVVNTRTDAAVKAKVVIRTAEDSNEALDFFIYLTPGDTWRGTLKGSQTAGIGHLTSTDDSIQVDSQNFASSDNPVEVDFADLTGKGQSSNQGHIEIIGVTSAVNGTYTVSGTDIDVKRGMSKPDLKTVMDNSVSAQPGTSCGTDTGLPGKTPVSPCDLQISGTATVRIPADDQARLSIEMTALGASNYYLGNVGVNAVGDSVITGETFPNYVISDPAFTDDLSAQGQESSLGTNFGTVGTAFAGDRADHIVPIENALAVEHASYPWEAAAGQTSTATITMTTFPTKYRHRRNDVCFAYTGVGTVDDTTDTVDGDLVDLYTQPFQNTVQGKVEYQGLSCNNSEGCNVTPEGVFSGVGGSTATELPLELNFYALPHFGTEGSGWENIHFAKEGIACPYNNVPAITSTLKVNNAINALWEKASYRASHPTFVE